MMPVSEAKVRIHELVRRAATKTVLLFRRGRPAAVLVSYDRWRDLHEEVEDLKDRLSVYASRESPGDLRIPLDKLKVDLGLTDED